MAAVLVCAGSMACAPNDSLMLAHETAAILGVRTLFSAEVQFYAQNGKYAETLSALSSAGLIPAALASGEKDGYVFTLAPKKGGFTITAAPKVFGTTGRRSFFCAEDGTIRQSPGPAPATETSPELK
jgi:type IV pilus assembly protein PilA